jgi:hypothetical protein
VFAVTAKKITYLLTLPLGTQSGSGDHAKQIDSGFMIRMLRFGAAFQSRFKRLKSFAPSTLAEVKFCNGAWALASSQ